MILNPEQEDAIKEFINIGAGHAAGALSDLTETHVKLSIPAIKVVKLADLKKEDESLSKDVASSVRINFKGFSDGTAALVFPPASALKLVSLVSDEEFGTPDMDSVQAGILTEIGNIILNHILGAIGNIFQQHLEYNVANYVEGKIINLIEPEDSVPDLVIMIIDTQFNLKELEITGDIVIFFKLGSLDKFIEAVESCLN
jgi:chemotaxis protein CheC